jgi:hypothetical protein
MSNPGEMRHEKDLKGSMIYSERIREEPAGFFDIVLTQPIPK